MVASWYSETCRTWGDVLKSASESWGGRPFIKFKEEEMNFLEMEQKVETLSKGLLQLGVEKGENIAIWMGNRMEWIVAQFAIYCLGCALVPVYTRWKRKEIEHSLLQSDATTLILEEAFLGKIDALAMLREMVPEVDEQQGGMFRSKAFPRLRRVVLLGKKRLAGTIAYADVMHLGSKGELESALESRLAEVDPFDVMNIMYTSGTTGVPKGGMSMHRNNLATAYLWGKERMEISQSDIVLHNLPLYSNLGCFIIYLSLLFGAKVVLTEAFDSKESLELIEEQKVTTVFGTPPMFAMLLDDDAFKDRDLSSLRKGTIGGSSIPPSLFRKIVEEMGVKDLISGYGLSEAGAVSNCTCREDSIEVRAETVGRPLANFRVKVADPKTGMEVPTGSEGEIWLKDVYSGSAIGKGYYRMHNRTAEVFLEDGWFRSGDLGSVDEKGNLRITGRLKDMALVGGFNVYPAEIEKFLQTHPKVQQAVVLGVPDKRLGEVVMAYIVLKGNTSATESEIIEFCKDNIGNYKVPKYVRFIDIKDIPFSGHEKIQKFKMKERAIKECNLEVA